MPRPLGHEELVERCALRPADGDRAAAEVVGEDVDTVGAAARQRDPGARWAAPTAAQRS